MKQSIQNLIDILYGFRKILAFFSLFIVAVIFRVEKLLDGGQFIDLMKAVTVSFFAGNSVEHFTSMVKDYIGSKDNNNT